MLGLHSIVKGSIESALESGMSWNGKTIVFDLDGTLVDTAPDLHAALQHCFEDAGLEAVDLETVRHAIGHGAKVMIETSARLKSITLSDDDVTALHKTFLEYYVGNISVLSTPFPGIIECLKMCRDNGAYLAVCTNKTQALAEQVLDELGLAPYFHAVIGADKASEKKPSPAHLYESILLAGGTPAEAVLVGDSTTDARSAAAANIPFILMTYGYTDDEVFRQPMASKLDRAGQIIPALQSIFS